MTEKILFIQLKQIGDAIMTTPAIKTLATTKPDAEIHFLTQTPTNQVFQYHPNISKIILYPSQNNFKDILSIIKKLRKENYAAVIDFQGLPKTAILSWLIKAPIRIGFNRRGRNFFYSHALDVPEGIHYSASQKTFLLSPLNIPTIENKIEFFIGRKEREVAKQIFQNLQRNHNQLLVSVSPVSRQPYKVWPAEKFANICDYMIEMYNAQIVFLWGPGESHFVESVKNQMKHKPLPDYDIPTIAETVALLEQVDLHIGNDNGPMHFAIAAQVSTIAIFGRPMLKNWTPPESSKHLAIEYDPGCKENCVYPKCKLECIKNLDFHSVKDLIDIQLNPNQ